MNALIGDNGIITKAESAKVAAEDASKREELELMLNEYNSSEALGESGSFAQFLKKLQENGRIDAYFAEDGKIVVEYKGSCYEMVPQKPYYTLGESLNLEGSGRSHIISKETIIEDDFEFECGNKYTIVDEFNEKKFNFVIPSAEGKEENAVTITLMADITIDNKEEVEINGEMQRVSAIELLPGAILNLYVGEGVTATVNSGFGEAGQTATGVGAQGGPGGKAGIHVPESATLNLYGEGKIICYGGDAGNGAGAVTGNTGGRRWSEELEQELEAMVEKVEMLIHYIWNRDQVKIILQTIILRTVEQMEKMEKIVEL